MFWWAALALSEECRGVRHATTDKFGSRTPVSPVVRPHRSRRRRNSNRRNNFRLLSPKTRFATEAMATLFEKTGRDHRMSRIDRIKKNRDVPARANPRFFIPSIRAILSSCQNENKPNSPSLTDLRLLSPKTRFATECPTRHQSPRRLSPRCCRQNRLRPSRPTKQRWPSWPTWPTRQNAGQRRSVVPLVPVVASSSSAVASTPGRPIVSGCVIVAFNAENSWIPYHLIRQSRSRAGSAGPCEPYDLPADQS